MSNVEKWIAYREVQQANFQFVFLFVRKHAGISLSWLGKPAFHSFILLAILQNGSRQSHYREVLRWEIFMEQKLRFGLDLGRLADIPAFIAAKSFDL